MGVLSWYLFGLGLFCIRFVHGLGVRAVSALCGVWLLINSESRSLQAPNKRHSQLVTPISATLDYFAV